MENRGICNTCIDDKGCVLRRKFPVWQCEEYSLDNSKTTKVKSKKRKKRV
jgi:hypothetical protein